VLKKKLFFNLRKAKNRIGAFEEGDLRPENKKQIASELNVEESEVESMNRRMAGADASLNAVISVDGENSSQWQDWLEDENADQAADYAEKEEFDSRKELLLEALGILNDREKDILSRRRLSESVSTLEELSLQYNISRERVRQLEVRAFEKLQMKMRNLAEDRGMI